MKFGELRPKANRLAKGIEKTLHGGEHQRRRPRGHHVTSNTPGAAANRRQLCIKGLELRLDGHTKAKHRLRPTLLHTLRRVTPTSRLREERRTLTTNTELCLSAEQGMQQRA